jgi:hypothetical protein
MVKMQSPKDILNHFIVALSQFSLLLPEIHNTFFVTNHYTFIGIAILLKETSKPALKSEYLSIPKEL